MTKSQQQVQHEIQRAELRLQKLPRHQAHDLKRLHLLCTLTDAYKRARQSATSKALQLTITKLYKRIKRNQAALVFPTTLIACATKS